MIYKKYGETFRKLRTQLELPLSYFENVELSKAALSKFERGESMIGFEKVVKALQLMGVTLEEYENVLNEYALSDSEFLIEKINNSLISGKKHQLRKFYRFAMSEENTLLALAAKGCCVPLTDEETDSLTAHFYDISIWRIKDLWAFYITLEYLAIPDILYILRFFIESGHKIFNSPKYRKYLIMANCHACAFLASKGYKDESKYIIERSQYYQLIDSMFYQNLCNGVQGFWEYSFGNKEEGVMQIKNSLEIFKALTKPELSKFYSLQYARYLVL